MVAFLSIVVAMGLLGLTVYGLHRFQNLEVEYSVDRSIPLPPLDNKLMRSERASPVVDTTPQPPVHHHESSADDDSEQASRKGVSGWQEAMLALKKAGDMDGAYGLCEQEFPLWSAYNQACIILRSRIGDLPEQHPQVESLMVSLYRLAAIAEFLHDKSPRALHLTPNQLKNLELGRLDALDFQYNDLGYAQLRLIRKSDVKLMQQLWGKPDQHALPRELYREWWDRLSPEAA